MLSMTATPPGIRPSPWVPHSHTASVVIAMQFASLTPPRSPARSDSKLYVVCCHATWNYGPCRKALNLLGDLVHIVQSGQMPVAQEFGLE